MHFLCWEAKKNNRDLNNFYNLVVTNTRLAGLRNLVGYNITKSTENIELLTDEELFLKVQQDDEQAFRILYRRYNRRVFYYCLRALQTREAAEDVFQTVMAAIYEKRHSFRGGNFAAWLFTIARNEYLKVLEKKKNTVDIESVAYSLQDTNDRTGEDVLLRETLANAIAKLPKEFREPLELRYFDGCSYEQIALITDISISLAKVRVFRAKKMLEKTLSPHLREVK